MNFQDPQSHAGIRSHAAAPGQVRKIVAVTILISVVIFAGLYTFKSIGDRAMRARLAGNRQAALTVSAETMRLSPMPQTLTSIGTLAAVHRVSVSSDLGGTVTRIAFEAGKHVRRGDLLVQLDDSSEQADLLTFKAQQRLSESTLKRSKDLSTAGFAARSQLDQSQAQYDVAMAGIARASSAIAKKAIRAPFDGTIGIRLIEVGQHLSPGEAAATLTDNSELHVNFTLPEQTRPHLLEGQTVDVTVDAYPDRVFPSKLTVIDPQIDEGARAIRLQAIADNADGVLMPGMYANVSVKLAASVDAITVPESAVTYSLAGNSVFVAVPGEGKVDSKPQLTAKRVGIKTGARIGDRVVVLEGLKAGDQVVTTGTVKLVDGAMVNLDARERNEAPRTLPRS